MSNITSLNSWFDTHYTYLSFLIHSFKVIITGLSGRPEVNIPISPVKPPLKLTFKSVLDSRFPLFFTDVSGRGGAGATDVGEHIACTLVAGAEEVFRLAYLECGDSRGYDHPFAAVCISNLADCAR